jgi:hypothetical protein
MDGLKTKVSIPLWRPKHYNEYSFPLEVHHVKKVYGYLANGSVDLNESSVNLS